MKHPNIITDTLLAVASMCLVVVAVLTFKGWNDTRIRHQNHQTLVDTIPDIIHTDTIRALNINGYLVYPVCTPDNNQTIIYLRNAEDDSDSFYVIAQPSTPEVMEYLPDIASRFIDIHLYEQSLAYEYIKQPDGSFTRSESTIYKPRESFSMHIVYRKNDSTGAMEPYIKQNKPNITRFTYMKL